MLSFHYTSDGTCSLQDPETGELHHNRAGAYTEALEHYVLPSQAIERVEKTRKLHGIDVCFGLGYNTWVLLQTLLENVTPPFSITVECIEKDPNILKMIPLVLNLDRFDILKQKIPALEHNIYYQTFDSSFVRVQIFENGVEVILNFRVGDVREEVPKLAMTSDEVPLWRGVGGDFAVDFIFHDPFSPARMPELWTVDLFRLYFSMLERQHGCVCTYSAAGAVRGGLREAGFTLYRTPALGNKTGGGTFAIVAGTNDSVCLENPALYFPLSSEEEAFIASRAGIPYEDETFQGERSVILQRRQQAQAASGRLKAVRHSSR